MPAAGRPYRRPLAGRESDGKLYGLASFLFMSKTIPGSDSNPCEPKKK